MPNGGEEECYRDTGKGCCRLVVFKPRLLMLLQFCLGVSDLFSWGRIRDSKALYDFEGVGRTLVMRIFELRRKSATIVDILNELNVGILRI